MGGITEVWSPVREEHDHPALAGRDVRERSGLPRPCDGSASCQQRASSAKGWLANVRTPQTTVHAENAERYAAPDPEGTPS
jgi:hypothetical protein